MAVSGVWSDAALEAPAIVAGLDDVAVVGEPVEERIGHLGVAEDGRPFAWRYSGGARLCLRRRPWPSRNPK
ncbi:MAG: hypothetical protein QOJ58_4541 [Alphaproteobacteria bacterium]|nr:hypothetical protein [Alphaproteobacteria bacterium]